jgi:hypothetical protein
MGATDFITKPINWLFLGYRVRYILRASKAFDDVLRAESKSRALLGAIPDGMLRVSSEGVILETRGSPDIGLVPVAEGVRPTIYEVLPTQFTQQLMQQARQALETRKVQVCECGQTREGKLTEWEVVTSSSIHPCGGRRLRPSTSRPICG